MALSTKPLPGDYDWGTALNAYLSDREAVWVRKATAQTITSSATLTNDAALAFPVVNGGSYIFRALLRVGPTGAGANGNIKVAFTFPGGTLTTIAVGPVGALTGGTSASAETASQQSASSPTPATTFGVSQTASTFVSIIIEGNYVATASGTVTLQWAQATSNAIGTVVDAGSHLKAERIA